MGLTEDKTYEINNLLLIIKINNLYEYGYQLDGAIS